MSETRTDYAATAHEEIAKLNTKRSLVAAERRGSGDLMARYFDNVDPEARGLYEEWVSVPPAEVLERQREGVGAVLPEPDPGALMPAPWVYS